MNRVYLQVKRIIDNLDFNKLYKGFVKTNFLIKYNNYLYGLNELIQYYNKEKEIIYENKKYIIIDLIDDEINIKNIVIEVIMMMFNNQFRINNCNKEKLQYLIEDKTSEYYIGKYQLNLLKVGILKGNNTLINDYLNLYLQLSKKYKLFELENLLEKNIGIKKYIKLKLLSMFKQEEYYYELKYYLDILEDPCKLLNYINYLEEYSTLGLLVNNIIEDSKVKLVHKEIEKPIFSFNKLIEEKDRKTKKILMHKMIHAKKTTFKGILDNIDFEKVLVSDNLFYLPNLITYIDNGKVITKKGDFILKVNNKLEIEDGYECLSLEKILA